MPMPRWRRSSIWRSSFVDVWVGKGALCAVPTNLLSRTLWWARRKGALCPPYNLSLPLMHADLSGFPAQHRLFAGDAPVITGQRAAFAEGAVAGNHERHRVLADGGA